MNLKVHFVNIGRVMLFLASLYSIFTFSWMIFFISFGTLAVSYAPRFLKRWFDVHIPVSFVFAVAVFVVLTIGLGEFADFYEKFPWWDNVLHLFSAIGFGLLGFLILYVALSTTKLKVHAGIVMFFAFAFGLAIGALWEIVEFIIDLLFQTTMQPSLTDTMIDLVLDLVGALLPALAGYIYLKTGHGTFVLPVIEEMEDEKNADL